MVSFTEYIEGSASQRPTVQEIEKFLVKYPWFMTARKMLAEETEKKDPILELHYLSHTEKAKAFSQIQPKGTIREQFAQKELLNAPVPGSTCESFSQVDIIDSFLQKEDLRVVANEQTPEYDAAQQSSVLELSDEMLSEELAGIYRSQGLNEQARQIYERLSLLYPEKSIYFAEIIGEMDKVANQTNN